MSKPHKADREEEKSQRLPDFCEDFLIYMEAIAGKSKNTVKEYRYDLLLFFGFIGKKGTG